MTTKETNIRAPAWQLMYVHPEQKTLIPLSSLDSKTLDLINTSDLENLFPTDREHRKAEEIELNQLKDKL